MSFRCSGAFRSHKCSSSHISGCRIESARPGRWRQLNQARVAAGASSSACCASATEAAPGGQNEQDQDPDVAKASCVKGGNLRLVISCELATRQAPGSKAKAQRLPPLTEEALATSGSGPPGGACVTVAQQALLPAGKAGSSSDLPPAAEEQLLGTEDGEQKPAKQVKVMHGDRYISKELRSLVKQIGMSMSSNRQAGSPFEMHVTSWLAGSDIDVFGQWIRVDTWPVIWHSASMPEVFLPHEVVMLSPDAVEPLMQLEHDKVYCVGGMVDRTVRKGVSLSFADEHGIVARRLPIQEHAEALGMAAGSCRSPVLNVSDVVAALVRYSCTGDWVASLKPAIPQRKKRASTPRKNRFSQDI